ncbi:MAG: xylulokinase [Planctomycetota bacterium]
MFIGIDAGTSGTKTLLCDVGGKILAEATFEYPLYSPRPGWNEQYPGDWWSAVCKGVRAVLRKAGVKKQDVAGVGLSGQMHGSVFLDRNNRVIRKAILWNDQRTAEQCTEIESLVGGRKKLISMVSNPALTGFTAPKILWLRKHEPRHYEKTKKILLPKDYIRFLMTGEYASEVSDASGTLLLDVRNRRWHKGVLSRLGIDIELLPRVYESQEVSGVISRQAASQIGLNAGTPVVGGGGDQPAGAVGNGIVKEGLLIATMGTSGVVFAHSKAHRLDPSGRVHTLCSCVAGEYCIFGCMLSAGGSFQWFQNQLGKAEIAAARAKGVDPYELLIKEAAKAPAGCEGLYFLPYLTGERTPHTDPYARGAWIGLTNRTTRQMMIRALLEGITYGMADQIEIMRRMGIKVSRVRASGGGALSKWWRKLQADIYNASIVTINTSAGPAYGAAILAMVGTGQYKSVGQACDAAIRQTNLLKPDGKMVTLYGRRYRLFGELYRHLKGDFTEMAGLVQDR